MPHCIIEYSKDLELSVKPLELINTVHQGAVNSELFDETHIKTRTLSYENYKTGAGDLRFLHVTTHLLSGRSIEQKSNLSQSILSQLELLDLTNVTMTVQICDIDSESYSKIVL